MGKTRTGLLAAAILMIGSAGLMAQEPRPYTEGPVVNVSYIKVKPGGFDAYMKFLSTTYKAFMEEQKKAGLILAYHVYQAEARSPAEADLILTTHYKNWAALDGLEDKTAAVVNKIYGSRDRSTQAAVAREDIRDVLGSTTVQELILK